MAEKAPEVKIKFIKKKGGHAGGHSGGAWKVAYADLVTAMMAFFLLMWLLGTASKAAKEGLAGYMREGAAFFQTDKGQSILAEYGKGILPGSRGMNAPTGGDDGSSSSTVDENDLEQLAMEATKLAIERAFDSDQLLQAFKDHISIDFTEEGMRIQIRDKEDNALFESGSDRLKPYTLTILREITKELAKLKNHVVVGGHTDSIPYASAGYSNWDLSASRANSALRAMMAAGLPTGQVKRVTGYAETVPLENHDPRDPQNRRISIVVLSSSYEDKEAALARSRN
ncbi:MAG: OmpA family protein [Holophagales bacterium]|jgi:chemotaxis protein MotB|nr:OmpA family protein [Holophagales bacterium]